MEVNDRLWDALSCLDDLEAIVARAEKPKKAGSLNHWTT